MVHNEQELEELLSRPSEADVQAAAQWRGDIAVLGAAGKMGPSLVRRIRRAMDAAGSEVRLYAVTRTPCDWGEGITGVTADFLQRDQVQALPDAENVIFMAGRKFGSTGNEPLTWAVNTYAPALVAERYARSRIVAFSTGNVYPFVPPESGGATEATPPQPVGEYAQSALGRERTFQYFSQTNGTPVLILRLNYAVEPRYGVLLEIGTKVYEKRPIDLQMGHVNVIWQGDANSVCLRGFPLCASPARILNLTGPETLAVRDLALAFGKHFDIEPTFTNQEADTALLNNASECHRIFCRPSMSVDQLITMIAGWIQQGGRTLGKPTHFETRTGQF